MDKDTSGLLLLTNDGLLSQTLAHPSEGKWKEYVVKLSQPLSPAAMKRLHSGVALEDGISRMEVTPEGQDYLVRLQEGRNRQIRRSFTAIGYKVTGLHRRRFAGHDLQGLPQGQWRELEPPTK